MATVACAGLAGAAVPAAGAPRPPAAPSGTAGAAHPPAVSRADTAGVPEATLYRRAVSLVTVERRDPRLQAAIDAVQRRLDADAVVADRAARLAASARSLAVAADRAERAARHRYGSLADALRRSALNLYMSGSTGGSAAGLGSADDLAWAQGLLDATVDPEGVIHQRTAALAAATHAATSATKEWETAARSARAARAAVADERSQGRRLVAALRRVDRTGASSLAAERTVVAAQAGRELTGPGALEFRPSRALPAPLPTTPTALAWAFAELGVPYLWGGTGVGGFDCSGLTQFVWAKAGVAIPRVSGAQYYWTDPVPLSQLQPGDLAFYVGSDGSRTDPGHVGIYIGDGLMIDAPHTGTVVQVSSIWWSDLIGFGRVHADGAPIATHQVPTRVDAVVPTAKPVPSETKPPPGWRRHAGKRHRLRGSGGSSTASAGKSTTTTTPPRHRPPGPSTTTTTTTVPSPSTTTPTLPSTTTTTAPTTTTTILPGGL